MILGNVSFATEFRLLVRRSGINRVHQVQWHMRKLFVKTGNCIFVRH
jgi:hypothetical protein